MTHLPLTEPRRERRLLQIARCYGNLSLEHPSYSLPETEKMKEMKKYSERTREERDRLKERVRERKKESARERKKRGRERMRVSE